MSNNTAVKDDLSTTRVPTSNNSTIDFCENYANHTEFSSDIDFHKSIFLSQIILLIFIIVCTVLGNTLVLVATRRERILHQPNKYFITCLAVADLLVGVLVAPYCLYLSIVFYKWHGNSLGPLLAKLTHTWLWRFLVWIDTLVLTTSIYTLTFISFDRYLKISRPLQYKSLMTTSRSLKIISIILLISSVFATYAATSDSETRGVIFVWLSFCDIDISIIYYTVFSISAFFLPTVIILIMYTLIFATAKKRRKMLRNGELGQTNNDENQRTTFLKDLKVIRMLLIVVGVFIFCWAPLFIYLLLLYHDAKILKYLKGRSTVIFAKIVLKLPLVNSVCNPIIYACLDQTYKKAFKKLFQRMMGRRNSNCLQPPVALERRQVRTRQQNE